MYLMHFMRKQYFSRFLLFLKQVEVIQQPVQPQPFKHLDEVVSAIRDLTVSFKANCIGQN